MKIIWIILVVILVIALISYLKFTFNDLQLGKMDLRYSNYFGAIEKFERVVKKDPNNPEAHLYLGLAFGKKKDYENALKEFAWLKKNSPDFRVSAEMHNEIGMFYYLKEMYLEAIEEFKKAAILKPNFSDTYFNLGTAYSASGDTQNAISSYLKVINIDPRHTYAHWNLAINFERNGDIKKAIQHWKKYIEVTPGLFRHPEIENRIAELEKQLKK